MNALSEKLTQSLRRLSAATLIAAPILLLAQADRGHENNPTAQKPGRFQNEKIIVVQANPDRQFNRHNEGISRNVEIRHNVDSGDYSNDRAWFDDVEYDVGWEDDYDFGWEDEYEVGWEDEYDFGVDYQNEFGVENGDEFWEEDET